MQKCFLILWMVITSTAALACEEYKTHTTEELKEFRNKLIEAEADPFDRLFSFEELYCNEDPVIRDYAIRQGLTASKDELVRNKIILAAVMQMPRLNIAMKKPKTRDATQFYNRKAGVLLLDIYSRVPAEGCLTLGNHKPCSVQYFVVRGNSATLRGRMFAGYFELTESNQFVGYVRYRDEKIPSTIDLF